MGASWIDGSRDHERGAVARDRSRADPDAAIALIEWSRREWLASRERPADPPTVAVVHVGRPPRPRRRRIPAPLPPDEPAACAPLAAVAVALVVLTPILLAGAGLAWLACRLIDALTH